MKRPWQQVTGAELVTVGVLAALGATIAVVGQGMFSPGPLSAAESGAPLEGVIAHADLSDQCGACHAPPWGEETMADRCLDCHSDTVEELTNPHEIHSRVLPRDEAWTCTSNCHTEHNGPEAPQTLLTKEHFTTVTEGYSLEGHQVQDEEYAIACIDCHPDEVSIFEVETCTTCHRDLDAEFTNTHRDTFGPACLDCHDGIDTYGADYDHNEGEYPLEGEHAAIACGDCHQGVGTIEELEDTPQDCYSCHEEVDTHEGQLGPECAGCHDAADWAQPVVDHALTDYPLGGKHAEATCADCHTDNLYEATPQGCDSCHQGDDAHRGTTDADCAQCHDTGDWTSVVFEHSLTDYPLGGKHAEATCADCHTGNTYEPIPRGCASCHQGDDAHQGTADADCAQCHNTGDWASVVFEHSVTDYPLTGKHAGATCGDCHADNLYVATPQDCDSCHQDDDAHRGTAAGCNQCHSTAGWAPATVSHPQTAFPLTGRHTGVACGSCHSNRVYRGTPTDCYSCHRQDDTHGGSRGAGCDQCHGTGGWASVTISHSQTAFPLTGAHSSVACGSCHSGGVYQGTATDCYSCHQQDDTHGGSRGTDCNECHDTGGWPPAALSHPQTAFPLTGAHSGAACDSCHSGGVYQGTPTDCYSCHQQDDTHGGSRGTSCNQCHGTGGWAPATIDHSQTAFPLTGAHSGAVCDSCHSGGVYQGTPTDCYSCHEQDDVHQGSLGTSCNQCHGAGGWAPATIDHSQTAFPLTGRHSSIACGSCHSGGVYQGTPTDCYSCHEQDDVHGGSRPNCGRCHNTNRW